MALRDVAGPPRALALNTATLGHNLAGHGAGWPPERVIDACAARGLAGVVFWRREIGNRAVEIGDRVRAAGMQVTGLCRTPYIVGREAGSGDDIRAAIDMAAALGTGVLTIVSGGTAPGHKGLRESRKILADRIAAVAGYAADRQVSLAVEPLNPMFGGNRTVVMTARDALEVCDMTGAANVGLAIDVYHVWWDTTLADSLRLARGRVLGFHLCDWLEDTRDMLLDRGMMGDGVADIPALRAAVEATGFDGACEVEVFSARDWWRRDPGDVLDIMVDRFRTHC